MKVKNIKLTIRDRKDVLDKVGEALSRLRKGKKIIRHEEISFQNMETLRKFLTVERMGLLHTIKQNAPQSIYELAKMANRDLKSVNTDINVLASLGLISLEKTKEERKKTKPCVDFDRLNVEITI